MRKGKGFTLIELMVVIAIIAVLGAVIAPQVFKQIDKARSSRVVSDYSTMKTAAYSYFNDTRGWPGATTGGAANGFTLTDGATGWEGPYLQAWPTHPWKRAAADLVGYHVATTPNFDGNNSVKRYAYFTLTNIPANERDRIETTLDGGAAYAVCAGADTDGTVCGCDGNADGSGVDSLCILIAKD